MRFAGFGVWLIMVLVGCDKPANVAASKPPAKTGSGVIRGVVRFVGTPPVMKPIENKPCHDGAGPITEETALVNENGTLRNVFVFVEDAGRSDGSNLTPVKLDQKDCRYDPHVLGIVAGQTLRIGSSDPAVHNVHYTPAKNAAENLAFMTAGVTKDVKFAEPEFITLRCDVHPWMNAYVGVFDNGFFDVTAGAGTFEIRGIAPGSYMLATWHERYGRLEKRIDVGDKPVQVELTYKQE